MAFSPCFVIPTYNHCAVLPEIVNKLSCYGFPCFIVDDGSNHETRAALETIESQHDWIHVIRLPENQGKGSAVIAGLREAGKHGHSHAIQIDADGQHELAALPALIDAAERNPFALISGRPVYDASIPKLRLYGRYITHIWVWIETLSLEIKDTMCGFRVYPLPETCGLIDTVRLGKRMDFDTEIMVRLYWRNVPVVFVPTNVRYPEAGVSHFKLFRDNLLISWMHTRLVTGMLLRLPVLLFRKLLRTQMSHL